MAAKPAPDDLMQFFEVSLRPEGLKAIDGPYAELAQRLAAILPQNGERAVALRKLLESKDAARRAYFSDP